jgi:hypothetical protein
VEEISRQLAAARLEAERAAAEKVDKAKEVHSPE